MDVTFNGLFFVYCIIKFDMPDVKRLASQTLQRYNTPNLNMKKSPSDHATAVLLHLVKKGSLTTCKTTDSAGIRGNSGNKIVRK